jgi:hypothetical protein
MGFILPKSYAAPGATTKYDLHVWAADGNVTSFEVIVPAGFQVTKLALPEDCRCLTDENGRITSLAYSVYIPKDMHITIEDFIEAVNPGKPGVYTWTLVLTYSDGRIEKRTQEVWISEVSSEMRRENLAPAIANVAAGVIAAVVGGIILNIVRYRSKAKRNEQELGRADMPEQSYVQFVMLA